MKLIYAALCILIAVLAINCQSDDRDKQKRDLAKELLDKGYQACLKNDKLKETNCNNAVLDVYSVYARNKNPGRLSKLDRVAKRIIEPFYGRCLVKPGLSQRYCNRALRQLAKNVTKTETTDKAPNTDTTDTTASTKTIQGEILNEGYQACLKNDKLKDTNCNKAVSDVFLIYVRNKNPARLSKLDRTARDIIERSYAKCFTKTRLNARKCNKALRELVRSVITNKAPNTNPKTTNTTPRAPNTDLVGFPFYGPYDYPFNGLYDYPFIGDDSLTSDNNVGDDNVAMVPGGISEIDSNNEGALNALKHFGIQVKKINKIHQQIVAGFKYYIEGSFTTKLSKEPKRCKISIIDQPWMEPPFEMTLMECDGENLKISSNQTK